MIKISRIQRDLPHMPHGAIMPKKFSLEMVNTTSSIYHFLSTSLLNKFYLRKRTYERLYSSNLELIKSLDIKYKLYCLILDSTYKFVLNFNHKIYIVNYVHKKYNDYSMLRSMKNGGNFGSRWTNLEIFSALRFRLAYTG